MRTIKFRGMSIDDREWVYGYLIHKEPEEDGGIYYIYNENPTRQYIGVFSKSIGQYTGLKDKNGVEIYEGDILKQPAFMCSDKLCRVFYDDIIGTGIGFQATEIPNGCDILSDEWDEFEVVGNVFENSELLED